MAAPLRIDELTALGSLSSGAAVAVVQGGLTLQVPASAFITQAPSFTQSGSGQGSSRSVQTELRELCFNVKSGPFGATGDGTTNDASAVQAAIDAAEAAGGGVVFFPDGTYIINSALTATGPIRFEGVSQNGTFIYRNFSPSSDSQGLFNVEPTGDTVSFAHLSIFSQVATTGGCLISVLADATNTPSFVRFDDIRLTTGGTDTHKYALYCDGSANAIGLRNMGLQDVFIFGGTSGAAFFKSLIQLSWHGGGTFQSGGTSGALEITGTSGLLSQYVDINVAAIHGLTLAYVRSAVIACGQLIGNVTNTSDTTEILLSAGILNGTVETDWTKSMTVEPGRLRFPATQNSSTNVNTLDDYVEGIWTPALTFGTPGDLSVAYTTQLGTYTKVGNVVTLAFRILTSSFTHTTASGVARITGMPFAVPSVGFDYTGALRWQGITKANYTDVSVYAANNTSLMLLKASGSAQSESDVTAADMPSGGSVALTGTITYLSAT